MPRRIRLPHDTIAFVSGPSRTGAWQYTMRCGACQATACVGTYDKKHRARKELVNKCELPTSQCPAKRW